MLAVNRLFYQFPIGEHVTATVGGRVRQDDMLVLRPSVYPADTVLDFFTRGGALGATASVLVLVQASGIRRMAGV